MDKHVGEAAGTLKETLLPGYNPAEAARMAKATRIRVVLADDHAVVREGTRRILDQEKDIQVVGEAADGEEAVALVARLHPDVAILDIAMPVVNGIEATQRIKALNPSTAVLILTAYDDDPYVFAVLEAGAAGYLLKYARGSELVDAIRAVQAGESVLHPSVARKVLRRLTHVPERAAGPSEHNLTSRELDILRLAGKGLSNKEIAETLVLSSRTVQSHLGNIFTKLNVGSRTEAVINALRQGWIRMDDIS